MGITDKKKEIKRLIKKSNKIFLMAHINLDLDALGSSIGLYSIIKKMKKECYIIIDEQQHELGVEKVLREQSGYFNIIKSEEIKRLANHNKDKNLLIILDTNKTELVQSPGVLKLFSNKLIIDHHEIGKTTIKECKMIIDNNVSSTCEMITELMMNFKIKIEPYFATILLSGIVLDTNNFTLKTTKNTYKSAYYLTSIGADSKRVQYLMKQDLIEYSSRQKLLTDIEIINKNVAFTKATPHIIYRREDLAKIADTLLFFNDIEISFVIGKIGKDLVGLSARSLGNIEIKDILANLGGGGSTYNGAAKFENMTISNVEELVKEEIRKQIGE